MIKREEIESFRRKWNIVHSDRITVERFANRLHATLEDMMSIFNDDDFRKAFRKYLGHKDDYKNYYKYFFETPIHEAIKEAATLNQLVEILQCYLWAIRDSRRGDLARAVRRIQEAVNASPEIHLHVGGTTDAPILYPGGDPLLDKAAVDDVLQDLHAYPEADRAFREALKIYLSRDVEKYRNLLDNLRFALEQVVQQTLGNKRTLENNKDDFLRWLKDAGLHSYIVQMYHSLIFGGFVKYQNEAVKHGSEYSEPEIEFSIYVTGLFLRVIVHPDTRPKSPAR